eukprot:scaffold7454_cov60-Phaeocystis_antarctica.AAC.5
MAPSRFKLAVESRRLQSSSRGIAKGLKRAETVYHLKYASRANFQWGVKGAHPRRVFYPADHLTLFSPVKPYVGARGGAAS